MAPSCASPTWKNDRAGEARISKRLDRFFALSSLLPHIQKHRVWANPSEVSDHYPVCLEWNTKFCVNIYPFKFNRAWLLEEGFSNLVKDYWTPDRSPLGDNDISSLVSKLKGLKVEVKLWEKKKRMVIKKELYEIDSGIQTLLDSSTSGIFNEQYLSSMLVQKSHKEKLLTHERLTWLMKSRIKWTEMGDANMKYFHSYASAPKNFNSIWSLDFDEFHRYLLGQFSSLSVYYAFRLY